MQVIVIQNQVERALKALKRQLIKEGLFKELKARRFYLKPSVKKKIKTVHEKQKVLDESRHALLEHLKGSKDLSKEDRCDLIKDFKEENAGKHQALKIAQKALVQEVREKAQTKDRRE